MIRGFVLISFLVFTAPKLEAGFCQDLFQAMKDSVPEHMHYRQNEGHIGYFFRQALPSLILLTSAVHMNNSLQRHGLPTYNEMVVAKQEIQHAANLIQRANLEPYYHSRTTEGIFNEYYVVWRSDFIKRNGREPDIKNNTSDLVEWNFIYTAVYRALENSMREQKE